MSRRDPKHRPGLDDLVIEDATWLDLGALRALVAKADDLGWDDSSLVSHSAGGQHISRHDVRTAHRILIEGRPS